MLRDIPFAVIQFSLYDSLKRRAAAAKGAELHWTEKMPFQCLAAAFAGGVTTPLDVVKTRLMTQVRGGGGGVHYLGWRDALQRIYREEGSAALLQGFRPRVLWLGFGGMVFMGSFEEMSRRAAQL